MYRQRDQWEEGYIASASSHGITSVRSQAQKQVRDEGKVQRSCYCRNLSLVFCFSPSLYSTFIDLFTAISNFSWFASLMRRRERVRTHFSQQLQPRDRNEAS